MTTLIKRPSAPLRPYLVHYCLWDLVTPHSFPPIHPGTGLEVLVNLGPSLSVRSPESVVIPPRQARIICPRQRSFTADNPQPAQLLSLRFRSAAWFQLFGIPLGDFADQLVDASCVLPASLLSAVFNAEDCCAMFATIEAFFLQQLSLRSTASSSAMVWAIDRVYYQQQRCLANLYRETGMSERSFQRKFKHFTGVNAKYFERTARFQASLKSLLSQPELNCLDLALSHGYYDQAYFSNEFKHFTGLSPQQYLIQRASGLSHYYMRATSSC